MLLLYTPGILRLKLYILHEALWSPTADVGLLHPRNAASRLLKDRIPLYPLRLIKFALVATTAWLRCAGGREATQLSNFMLLEILLSQSSIWFSFGGWAQFISAGASLLIQLSYRCRQGEGSKQDWCQFFLCGSFSSPTSLLLLLLSKIKRGQNQTFLYNETQTEGKMAARKIVFSHPLRLVSLI